VREPRTLRELDRRCLDDLRLELGDDFDEAEVRRLWRAWDLELFDDLELELVTVAEHLDPLELLTLAEVSRLAKRHRSTLHRDIAAGRLHVVKLGRSTRVPRSELERYLAGDAATMPAPTPLRKGQS
jgi:excisionase family DNA binding protein